jgi:phosphotriesterase-related protein
MPTLLLRARFAVAAERLGRPAERSVVAAVKKAVVGAVVAASWPALGVTSQAPPPAPKIPNMAGKIMTVNGPIEPDQAGHTLMHEHLFIDFSLPDDAAERWQLAGRTKPTTATAVKLYSAPLTMDILGAVILGAPNRDNWLLTDEQVAIKEIGEFKTLGGGTVVDVTSIGLDRNPEKLRRVAQASGLNIVMGASWYQKAWHPKSLDDRSVESLTDEVVRDVTTGVGDSGIRSGIIGEVGTTGNPLTPNEIKVIRASGRASRLTGAAITLHTAAQLREQPRILDLLEQEGADLERVVIGHSDGLADDLPFMTQLLRRGVTIEFDLLGRPPTITRGFNDLATAKAIVELVKAGYGGRIVLSHDICTKVSLTSYGGSGYGYIEEFFLPYLKRQGVTEAQISTIMVENPKRILTFAATRGAQRAS